MSADRPAPDRGDETQDETPPGGDAGISGLTEILARALGTSEADPGSQEEAKSELWSRAYDEIRKIAAWKFSDERPGHTLQITALVSEAYLRLESAQFESRAHFFFAVGRAIKQILIEHARHKKSQKAGGEYRRVDLDFTLPGFASSVDPLELEEALEKLQKRSRRSAEITVLHGYVGLSLDEAAEVLEISRRTAADDWKLAKMFLRAEMRSDSD